LLFQFLASVSKLKPIQDNATSETETRAWGYIRKAHGALNYFGFSVLSLSLSLSLSLLSVCLSCLFLSLSLFALQGALHSSI
jgi:hypothetical protein